VDFGSGGHIFAVDGVELGCITQKQADGVKFDGMTNEFKVNGDLFNTNPKPNLLKQRARTNKTDAASRRSNASKWRRPSAQGSYGRLPAPNVAPSNRLEGQSTQLGTP
jgi:hypothetical protein